MAHFAELNENNEVLRVIVVLNSDVTDVNGVESEELGIAFCKRLFGLDTIWKQTSYNNNFRFRYAGIGFTYDQVLDAFIAPKPYPSWLLDPTTAEWKAPVPMPTLTEDEIKAGHYYAWDENSKNWVLSISDPAN